MGYQRVVLWVLNLMIDDMRLAELSRLNPLHVRPTPFEHTLRPLKRERRKALGAISAWPAA
ncbi:MAG: hypothetical protein ACYC3N_09285 [Halothiobacillus sp.]